MSILEEAKNAVIERGDAYGAVLANWRDIADLWTVILGRDVKAHEALLCMIAVKLARECHSHKWDNIVDIAGYAECLGKIHENNALEGAYEQERKE